MRTEGLADRRHINPPLTTLFLYLLALLNSSRAAPTLPFLYPSTTEPRRRRTRVRRWIDPVSSQVAKTLATKFKQNSDGVYEGSCWSLRGRSNCPRDNFPTNEGELSFDDPSLPDIVDAVSSPSSSSSSSTTSIPSADATPSTVEPYIMSFNVTNIPAGWQKKEHSPYYSKRVIIGFSVSLSVFIVLTIIICVIWRLRAASRRKDLEKQLEEKKEQIRNRLRGLMGIEEVEVEEDRLQDDSPYRPSRKSLRRRVWKRMGHRQSHEDDGDSQNTLPVPTRTTRFRWRSNPKRKTTIGISPTLSPPPSSSQQNLPPRSSSPSLTTRPSSSAPPTLPPHTSSPSAIPLPLSPPISPPPTSPIHTREEVPPAYRRRNFNLIRPATAPARVVSTNPVRRPRSSIPRPRTGKEREAEEYASLAPAQLQIEEEEEEEPPNLAFDEHGHVILHRDLAVHGEDQDDGDMEEDDAYDDGLGQEAFTGHLGVDDKQVLRDLREAASAPSHSHPEEHIELGHPSVPEWEEEDDQWETPEASTSASTPPTTLPSLPSPPPVTTGPTRFLVFPPPPASQPSALPRYLTHQDHDRSSIPPSLLPDYVDDGSHHSRPVEKQVSDLHQNDGGDLLPSAPPLETDDDPQPLVPSAPPLDDPDETLATPSVPPPPPPLLPDDDD